MKYHIFIFIGLAIFFSGCAMTTSEKLRNPASQIHSNKISEIQSRFIGPVHLKVWKSWLESDNVEDITGDSYQYELIRGKLADPGGFIHLRFRSGVNNLRAVISSKYIERVGEWDMKSFDSGKFEVQGKTNGGWSSFYITKPDLEFVDLNEKRVVTAISFKIFKDDKEIYSATVLPMYVRGKSNHYWKNPVPGFSSHAGGGEMSIETSLKFQAPWETWNGKNVMPVVNFIEKQNLSANSTVGLHRMERNQKIWLIESGQVIVQNGISFQSSAVTKSRRPWPGEDTPKETTEFAAIGGWLEERILEAGDMMIMIPTPEDEKQISFQGMHAIKQSAFWVMGKYN